MYFWLPDAEKHNSAHFTAAMARQERTPALVQYADRLPAIWNVVQRMYTEIDNDSAIIPFSPCHLYTGEVAQHGYGAYTVMRERTKIYTHVLAMWSVDGRLDTGSLIVSHLCHRKSCMNPEHLTLETRGDNSTRNTCVHAIRFNEVIVRVCPHNPTCLRSPLDGFEPVIAEW